MINNIVILRDFRNYFMNLKSAGVGNRFELELLDNYFPKISIAPYFTDNDVVRDQINLLHLMKVVNDKITNEASRGKIVELYTELFALN